MSDHLETLRQCQDWRRGDDSEMLPPKEIGYAIDAVMAEVKRLRPIEAAARNLVAVRGRHHSAIAYQRLVEAIDKKTPANESAGGRCYREDEQAGICYHGIVAG